MKKIGIVFPSSKAKNKNINAALEMEINWEPKFFYANSPSIQFLAGTDEERTNSLINALLDNEVGCLLVARGGYGAARLDFDRLEKVLIKNQKPLIGFSDATYILHYWNQKGAPAFHGPVLTQIPNLEENSFNTFKNFIQEQEYSGVKSKVMPIVSPPIPNIDGIISGGNLTVLASMVGTSVQPDFAGTILILEDINEPPYKIDRMLNQLYLATNLKECSAIILGGFTGCDTCVSTISSFLKEVIKTKIPLFYGMNVGHDSANTIFRLGESASIKSIEGEWFLVSDCLR